MKQTRKIKNITEIANFKREKNVIKCKLISSYEVALHTHAQGKYPDTVAND